MDVEKEERTLRKATKNKNMVSMWLTSLESRLITLAGIPLEAGSAILFIGDNVFKK